MSSFEELDVSASGASHVFARCVRDACATAGRDITDGIRNGVEKLVFNLVVAQSSRDALKCYFHMAPTLLASPTELSRLDKDVTRLLQDGGAVHAMAALVAAACQTAASTILEEFRRDTLGVLQAAAAASIQEHIHETSRRMADYAQYVKSRFRSEMDAMGRQAVGERHALDAGGGPSTLSVSPPRFAGPGGAIPPRPDHTALQASVRSRMTLDEARQHLCASLDREHALWDRLEDCSKQLDALLRSETVSRAAFKQRLQSEAQAQVDAAKEEVCSARQDASAAREELRTALRHEALAIAVIRKLDDRCVRISLQHRALIQSRLNGTIVSDPDVARVEHAMFALDQDRVKKQHTAAVGEGHEAIRPVVVPSSSHRSAASTPSTLGVEWDMAPLVESQLDAEIGVRLQCVGSEALPPGDVTRQQIELLKGAVRYFEMKSEVEHLTQKVAILSGALDALRRKVREEQSVTTAKHRADLLGASAQLAVASAEALRWRGIAAVANAACREASTTRIESGDAAVQDLVQRLHTATRKLRQHDVQLTDDHAEKSVPALPSEAPAVSTAIPLPDVAPADGAASTEPQNSSRRGPEEATADSKTLREVPPRSRAAVPPGWLELDTLASVTTDSARKQHGGVGGHPLPSSGMMRRRDPQRPLSARQLYRATDDVFGEAARAAQLKTASAVVNALRHHGDGTAPRRPSTARGTRPGTGRPLAMTKASDATSETLRL